MKIFISKMLPTAASVLLLTFITGCGSRDGLSSTNEQDAYARVSGLGDLASDESRFNEAFVAGSVPKDREAYAKYGYDISGVGTFEGETAIIPVTITGGVFDSEKGDREARRPSSSSHSTQRWTLQLVDGDWKLKDAPLS
ncbi:hypothetical protein [Rubripirellula reticaptiva]|uniref:DUF4878 domain-containing protein n=1 Tax=Rubripirellula reticaptiva TaxID=2528013 RepID=A0A5C6EI80_9BACT|nr:hypothetical protein [Rubripirellula reticaptiva]TWU48204.1 hypothetical protein Poly59_50500 [Rubripirellula reticaptiva]